MALHVIGGASGTEDGLSQEVSIRQADAEHRLEHTGLVSAFSMHGAEDVVLQFAAEVSSIAIRELHWASMCHAQRIVSIGADTRQAPRERPCR